MTSTALSDLSTRLQDVDELIMAHVAITGGGRGRPGQRQGAAVTKAGVVLLAAATEAYVEELFEESAEFIFHELSREELDKLFKNTSGRLNNADTHKIEMLYFNLGLAWALSEIRWKKYSNDTFRKDLNRLIEARNKIAHGKNPTVRLSMLRKWKNMIEQFAPRFESRLAGHIGWMRNEEFSW